MCNDFIHYIRREVRQVAVCGRKFYAAPKSDIAGLLRPGFHVTRSLTGPAARVREGDTIWLVSQLFTPWGEMPPSIDARVDVVAVSKRRLMTADGQKQDALRYEAAGTSRWFPLADASPVLRRLRTRDARGAVAPLVRDPAEPVGRLLQSMRELNSGDPLRSWEARLDARGFDFVSYRLADGTEAAHAKVRALLRRGRAVFWDRWSLPRRLAERRERIEDAALDAHIRRQLAFARDVWAIRSPLYGEAGSYSARELAIAVRRGTLRWARG